MAIMHMYVLHLFKQLVVWLDLEKQLQCVMKGERCTSNCPVKADFCSDISP